MLLVIDVGNTNIVFGLFAGKRMVNEWRYATDAYKIPKIKGKIEGIVIASVVPLLNKYLREQLKKLFRVVPFFVSDGNVPDLIIRLANKKEIGADRVVNALAAYKLFKQATIIVDFGTATTFDVVSAKGEYLGGAIAPGIRLAKDALYERTAKLPKIKIVPPKNVIGKNTEQAMQSGLVYGYVAMIEGMIKRIKDKAKDKVKVVATGGLAPLICKYTSVVDKIDTKLTLKGLCMIGEIKL